MRTCISKYFECLVAEIARSDQDDREPRYASKESQGHSQQYREAERAATEGHRGKCMNRARLPPGKCLRSRASSDLAWFSLTANRVRITNTNNQ
jgi:hypothetical protein